jgi:alpha-ketoglutarate-dependent taurine dioxygenase
MPVAQHTRVEFEPIKPLVGSRVHVSRQDLFDPEVIHQIRRELDERVILIFPQLGLDNTEQLALTDALGQRQNLTSDATTDKSDDVYKVTLDPKINRIPEYVLGTFFYHIDGMPIDPPPPYATLLSARRVAEHGGQTEFASTSAAYDALSDPEKEEFEHLRVRHSVASSLRAIADVIPEKHKPHLGLDLGAERPLVYTRGSGRKSLLVGSTADTIVGRDVAHGRSLLARLQEYAAGPDFSYKHYWTEGDLAIWVNPAAMHRVVPYDAQSGRMMHRTTVGAEKV